MQLPNVVARFPNIILVVFYIVGWSICILIWTMASAIDLGELILPTSLFVIRFLVLWHLLNFIMICIAFYFYYKGYISFFAVHLWFIGLLFISIWLFVLKPITVVAFIKILFDTVYFASLFLSIYIHDLFGGCF